jgi:hypothetical protein
MKVCWLRGCLAMDSFAGQRAWLPFASHASADNVLPILVGFVCMRVRDMTSPRIKNEMNPDERCTK